MECASGKGLCNNTSSAPVDSKQTRCDNKHLAQQMLSTNELQPTTLDTFLGMACYVGKEVVAWRLEQRQRHVTRKGGFLTQGASLALCLLLPAHRRVLLV